MPSPADARNTARPALDERRPALVALFDRASVERVADGRRSGFEHPVEETR
jgi:hypothetical protein